MQTIIKRILRNKAWALSLIILIVTLTAGCINFATRPETRLKLCWIVKGKNGPVLASYPNPDSYFIIHVVQPVCGQSYYWRDIYDCSVRLDLESGGRIIKGYEMGGECTASIKWLNSWEFEVTTQSGKKRVANTIDDFGVLP